MICKEVTKVQVPFDSCNLFRNAVYLCPVSCRRTAIPNAFFVPTSTTNLLPLVTAV